MQESQNGTLADVKFLARDGGCTLPNLTQLLSLWKITELHANGKQINLKSECFKPPPAPRPCSCPALSLAWSSIEKEVSVSSPQPPVPLLPPKLPLGKLAHGLCQNQGYKLGTYEPDVAGGGLLEPPLVVVALN